MKKILVLAITLLSFSSIQAQDNRILELALDKLDREIHEVRRLAERYNMTGVMSEIDQAKSFFDEAKKFFDLFKQFPQFNVYRQRAVTNYTKSKAAVKSAFKQILFQPTTRILNETDQKIIRAESLIQAKKNSPESVSMLNRARRFRDLAGRSLRDDSYLQAQEYLRISLFFAQKTIDLLDGNTDSELLKNDEYLRSWQNLNQLFNQYSNEQHSGGEVTDLIIKIRLYFHKAGVAYESGNLKEAIVNLQLAERLLFRLLDLQDSSTDLSEKMRDQITDLNQVLDGIELESLGQENPQYDLMLRKARQYLLESEQLAEQGALIRAKQSLNLAQRLVMKIQQTKGVQKNTNAEEIKSRLTELKQVIPALQNRSGGNELAQNLLAEAGQYLQNADEKLANQHPVQAHLLVQSALHLVLQADKLLTGEQESQAHTGQDLRLWHNGLQEKVNRLKQSRHSADHQLIIENLDKELARAGQLYEAGQTGKAAVWLSVIELQLNDIVKNLVN